MFWRKADFEVNHVNAHALAPEQNFVAERHKFIIDTKPSYEAEKPEENSNYYNFYTVININMILKNSH